MPEYKLTYYNTRGVSEPIRLIFAYSGTPYKDIRLPLGKLTAEKKEELGLEWGQLPKLEIDGVRTAQSWAIARFLARSFGLAGTNEVEQFRCDEIVEAVRDYFIRGAKLFDLYFEDLIKFREELKIFVDIDSKVYLKRFNDLLEKQGRKWLVGDDLTYADLYMEHMSTHFETVFDVNLTSGYPALLTLIDSVQNHPKLKQWYKERPKTLL